LIPGRVGPRDIRELVFLKKAELSAISYQPSPDLHSREFWFPDE
jgi:hypothetical protein